MGVFEELERLRAEKAEEARREIEITARVIAEPGERLRRRGELLEDVAERMFRVADAIERYGRKMKEPLSEDDRRDELDRLENKIEEMGDGVEDIAREIVEDVEDEQKERRAHEDAELILKAG